MNSRSFATKKSIFIFIILFIILFFTHTQDAFAANRYWVGSDGGSVHDVANWSATQNACGVGGGASVPGSADVAYFTSSCTNTANLTGNWTVGGINMASGTFNVGNNDMTVGTFTLSGGTFNASSGVTMIPDVEGSTTDTKISTSL